MLRNPRITITLMFLASWCQLAGATELLSPDVVRVTALRAVPWKSYRAIVAGIEAYEKNKDLAPEAAFSFGVVLPSGEKLPSNFSMRVRTPDGTEYPITMNDVFFDLPKLPNDDLDADLVTNLKGTPVKIGVQVRTPGLPPGTDRLGDLRLSCKIQHAIQQIEDSILARLLRPNPCESAIGSFWTTPSWHLPTSGAYLMQDQRTAPLERSVEQRWITYRIPVHDTSWSNDTLVHYKYTKTLNEGAKVDFLKYRLGD